MSLPPSDNEQLDLVDFKEDILHAIVECIENKDKHTLRRLLEICKGKPFSAKDICVNEKTPLHVAASKAEYKECLQLILEYSESLQININDDTIDGDTALYLACCYDCDENVLLLCQNRCDVNMCYMYTALHAAARNGNLKIAQHLLDYGANILKTDFHGMIPLHTAALYGHVDVARLLLKKRPNTRSRADTRSLDFAHNLPLFLACMESHYDMIRVLVEHDSSSINYQNPSGVTALMVASKHCPDQKFVHFLHENGASFSCEDSKGRLALHYAAQNGNVEVLQYVLEHTDASSIDKCFHHIQIRLQEGISVDSLACCAIDSKNLQSLEMLISSEKVSRCILQTPRMIGPYFNSYHKVYSPLSLLFKDRARFTIKNFDLYLQFLLEHQLMKLDEFFGALEIKLPLRHVQSPFTEVFYNGWPFCKQLYYFNWLNTFGITVDYCLQYSYDNTRLFASFDEYARYYESVFRVVLDINVRALELMMSNSAILEPDVLLFQLNKLAAGIRNHSPYADSSAHNQFHVLYNMLFGWDRIHSRNEICEVYQYLISLKPIFHLHAQLYDPSAENNKWVPRYIPNTSQEFAASTLKQLCRTTIRQQLRKDTLEANLRDFRRSILELPLPPPLKDYLLFKS